jgi:hypothetical protein
VCLECALSDRGLLRRALATSLVVSTVLLIINQGDAIAGGVWPLALAWKVPLTYAVPFVVCMWGALTASRRRS